MAKSHKRGGASNQPKEEIQDVGVCKVWSSPLQHKLGHDPESKDSTMSYQKFLRLTGQSLGHVELYSFSLSKFCSKGFSCYRFLMRELFKGSKLVQGSPMVRLERECWNEEGRSNDLVVRMKKTWPKRKDTLHDLSQPIHGNSSTEFISKKTHPQKPIHTFFGSKRVHLNLNSWNLNLSYQATCL